MKDIEILRSKNKVYQIRKKDIWKIFMFLMIFISSLMFSVLKLTNIKTSFIVLGIFFIITIIFAWIVFIQKIKII